MYPISSRGQPTRGTPSAWSLGEMLISPQRKNLTMLRTISQKPRVSTDRLVRHPCKEIIFFVNLCKCNMCHNFALLL